MANPKAEDPQLLLRCGKNASVSKVEIETTSVVDESTSERISCCGVASSGCSRERDAYAGPESGWSTVLHNCEKNIPLSSFVPYVNRLSMHQVQMASHPLDLLTDPTRSAPDCDPDHSGTLKGQDCSDEKAQSESPSLLVKPVVQLRASSTSETVDSRTSSDSNLQSFHENQSIADLMPPSSENARVPSGNQPKEVHGLMSMHFVPKRPISQICSRTVNTSSIWKMGNAPAEGPHHCHPLNSACAPTGNPWKSACNISEQIQVARSCGQRGSSSLLTNGIDRCEEPPLPGPCDDSSAESSRLASSSSTSTVSQVSFSLETAPTQTIVRSTANLTQVENKPRSRLSSFDHDFYLSTASSRSRSSSFVSSVEEKQAVEIRKLRHELQLANEKITSLMMQLNMNVVLATTYEQNLESMSKRHQHLATLLEEKSSELQKLRSSCISFDSCDRGSKSIPDSVNFQSCRRKSSSISNFPTDSKAADLSFCRQVSSDSLNSESSSCSAVSQPCASNGITLAPKKKSKKNWIRKSLSKAFSIKKKHNPYMTAEMDAASFDSSPSYSDAALEEKSSAPVTETASSNGTFHESMIADLQKQLHERDAEVMDLKLEALSSVQQMEQQRAMVVQLKKQIASLRSEQINLKRQVMTQGQSFPQLTSDRLPSASVSNHILGVSSAEPSTEQTTVTSDFSVDGHPQLSTQESFIYSSPKFLHKFSLKSAVTSVSMDDCFLPVKPSNVSNAMLQRISHRDGNKYSEKNRQISPKISISDSIS